MGENKQTELKVESEATEGEEDDAVTAASHSNTKPVTITRGGRIVCIPKR